LRPTMSAFSVDLPTPTQRLQYHLEDKHPEYVTKYNIFVCPPMTVTQTLPSEKEDTVSFMLSCLDSSGTCTACS
jgi:hypothetical protein